MVGLIIMAVLGEWLCLRKEMQAIPIVSGVGGASTRQPAGAATRGSVGVALTNLSGRLMSGAGNGDKRERDRDKDGPVP